jgi:hypothetical protein
MSASGACTPIAQFVLASASPLWRVPASATCTIITRTGGSTSTSAPPATTLFASSTIRRLAAGSKWHDKDYEIRRPPRDASHKRKWRVVNKATGKGYDVIPGPHDGGATQGSDWPFGRGDVWILLYRGSEIDDGVAAIGPPYEAGLDAWLNGEPINGADVVVWYGAHFTHDIGHEEPGEFGHLVGPDLKPVN